MAHIGSSLRLHQRIPPTRGSQKTFGMRFGNILSWVVGAGGVYVLILVWMHLVHIELHLETETLRDIGAGSGKFSALATFAADLIEDSSQLAQDVMEEIQEDLRNFDADTHSHAVTFDWLKWKDTQSVSTEDANDASLELAAQVFQHMDDDGVIAVTVKNDALQAAAAEEDAEDDPVEDDNVVKEVGGVVQQPRLRGASFTGSTSSPDGSHSDLHILFSTDCSFYQDWQSLVVFHSAFSIGQKAHITRVASGCDAKAQYELQHLYERLWPATRTGGWLYGVHFTPDFKRDAASGKKYEFYNKPYGMKHWLDAHYPTTALQQSEDVVLAIIDPDFLFLRPLTTQLSTSASLHSDSVEYVRPGHPGGQLYGLQAPWTLERNRDTSLRTKKGDNNYFDLNDICGQGSPCFDVSTRDGNKHYAVGPPYLIHIQDFGRLVNTWVTMVPKVYRGYPHLLAEMYAYVLAAAHEKLPHTTVTHHMVSNVFASANDEGWTGIDSLGDNVCQPPAQQRRGDEVVMKLYPESKEFPTFMHYCQFYRAKDIGFQKRRFHKKYFGCAAPLLLEPPLDLGTARYKNRDGEIVEYSEMEGRRNAFALCAITRSINRVVMDIKQIVCSAGGDTVGVPQVTSDPADRIDVINTNKTVNLAVDWP